MPPQLQAATLASPGQPVQGSHQQPSSGSLTSIHPSQDTGFFNTVSIVQEMKDIVEACGIFPLGSN